MSKIIFCIAGLMFFLSGKAQSVYQCSVESINGSTVPLTNFQGKKILIVTLPIAQNSAGDSVLHAVDSLSSAYANTLRVIGFPTYEDGFTQAAGDSLFAWYKSILGSTVIISKAVYSHKIAGNDQHGLFKWLTDKDLNGHVNKDVSGPLNKFIIHANGQLAAVLEESTQLNDEVIKEILDTP